MALRLKKKKKKLLKKINDKKAYRKEKLDICFFFIDPDGGGSSIHLSGSMRSKVLQGNTSPSSQSRPSSNSSSGKCYHLSRNHANHTIHGSQNAQDLYSTGM